MGLIVNGMGINKKGSGKNGSRRGRWKRRPKGLTGVEKLVITLQMDVHTELGDENVFKFMRWVWEKCVSVWGGGKCMYMGDGD
jgi:hypothetical protein